MDFRSLWQAAFSLFFCLAMLSEPATADVTLESPASSLIEDLRSSGEGFGIVPTKVLRITGEIRAEDATKAEEILNRLQRELGFQEGIYLLALLDSPGGNFKAGIALARLFGEFGIPTIVPRHATCMSACAVAFMGGTWVSMGGEGGSGRLRMAIAPSEIGFHRPFVTQLAPLTITPNVLAQLSAEQVGAFFEEQYSVAFDTANELIEEMLAVNPNAWNPDLLLRMLTAKQGGPDGGFVRLETVQDALLWDILVLGLRTPNPRSRQELHDTAFALCFNRGPQIPSSIDAFWPRKDRLQREYDFNMEQANRLYDGLRYVDRGRVGIFIHHEAPMGCEVTFGGDRARLKVDQGFLPMADSAPTENIRYKTDLGGLLAYHPYAKLEDLATEASTKSYRCMVLAGPNPLDNDPCRRVLRTGSTQEIIDTFIWPSGSRTVMQTRGVQTLLNGSATTPVTVLPTGMEQCVRSEETGRTFCFGAQ